jgi:hypothetical protein
MDTNQLDKLNDIEVLENFISENEELEDLVNLKEYFSSIPTILVLPDDNIETLQRGMLLHPLYFMAKHAELCQYSFAVNELCYIYEDRLNQSDRYSFAHNRTV